MYARGALQRHECLRKLYHPISVCQPLEGLRAGITDCKDENYMGNSLELIQTV
jgi:hypothetical protein